MKLCMGCMENIEDNVTTCPHCGYDETTLRQESYYLDPGTVVGGKYIVGRVISYGGYTITYLGMDAENNQKVMVKEYLPSDFSTRSEGETEVTIYSGDALEQFEHGLTTFLNEANRIQHLNGVQGIAKVYDCVAENDTGYVISEYVEGQTLKEVLDAGRIFTPQEAKVFICQILEGLRQVHPLDIIHCDISPETIMLTNTGEIKLMDFGATRYVTTANSKSLAIILKQGYAPEEQYRSRGVRGPWTDVYALGAVMYRMITGKVPTESVDRALQDELKEPSQLGISIPQNLENALMNALNVYQSDRTPSAEVFLRELNSPEVRRIQVKKRKNDTGKFPKWAKGLVAGLLCVILAGGTYIVVSNQNNDVQGQKDNTNRTPEIVGMTEEAAKKKLKKHHLNYVSGGIIFDLESEEKVVEQNPESSDPIEKNGTVVYRLRTNKKCTYKDIMDNVDSIDVLAKSLGIKNTAAICADATGEDKDTSDKTFGNLHSIKLKNEPKIITLADLEKKKNENKEITIADIEKIYQYVSPFIYVESMGNYEGRNCGEVLFDTYKIEKGKLVKQGNTGVNAPVERNYYSLDKGKGPGYIVKQNVKQGEKYDRRDNKQALFSVVKTRISGGSASDWEKKLGKLENELGSDITIEFAGSKDEGDPVKTVYAVLKDKRTSKIFKKNEVEKIIIETMSPATPTPKPTQVPQPRTPVPRPQNDTGSSFDLND